MVKGKCVMILVAAGNGSICVVNKGGIKEEKEKEEK